MGVELYLKPLCRISGRLRVSPNYMEKLALSGSTNTRIISWFLRRNNQMAFDESFAIAKLGLVWCCQKWLTRIQVISKGDCCLSNYSVSMVLTGCESMPFPYAIIICFRWSACLLQFCWFLMVVGCNFSRTRQYKQGRTNSKYEHLLENLGRLWNCNPTP